MMLVHDLAFCGTIALALGTGLAAGSLPAADFPAAALIDVDRSPVGALLEQTLLADKEAQWLERTEIDRVLRERELGALLGPAAAAERSSVGRLLKADLLVLLRHAATPAEHADLVVCETSRIARQAEHARRKDRVLPCPVSRVAVTRRPVPAAR
jgi:hypothetical protein